MSKIPTAEELFNQIYMVPDGAEWTKDAKKVAIEVAKSLSKLHVEAALKAAAQNASIDSVNLGASEFQTVVDKESILLAYPLENIQ